MEAEKDHIPVVVTQIHPARVDTPYTDHAASYIDKAPSHDGMMYPPETVAEAILHAAEHPVRDMYVGTRSKLMSLMGAIMPRFTDRFLKSLFTRPTTTKRKKRPLRFRAPFTAKGNR
ncbi:MAG: hypothetical protein U5K84_06210 [Alkalibacterium sp.]|nr:hypothetical protein [Alkalibacterium sp.]